MKRKADCSFLLKIIFSGIFLLSAFMVSAQENEEKTARQVNKFMKEAEEAMAKNDFSSAEAYYRQAIAKDPGNAAARYNLGNLYYNKEMPDGAVKRHSQAGELTTEKPIKHQSFHNQGNAFMKQKKYAEAIEAYKNSLRNNPHDEETRYNLALAKKMLEEEQEEGGGGDDQDENEGENQDQENDDENQGDEGEEEQNEDGDQKENDQGGENENEDKKEGEDEKGNEGDPKNEQEQEDKGDNSQEEEQPQQQQPVPGQLSPQQIKNLLEAMGNEEKKVQDKINAEKAKGAKTKSEKDW